MEYRSLGSTEEKISAVSLGAWQFSESWGLLDYEMIKKIISTTIDNGINMIDTAIAYGRGKSEDFVGRALEELNLKEKVFVATKIPGEMLGYHDVLRAVRGSLRRLRKESIDLLQVHSPPLWNNIPTCEYMRALEKLVIQGLVRYIGVSNFPSILVEEANFCLSREEVVSNQVRYNLIERDAEKEIIPHALQNDMSIIAWSPLAKGALSGKYTAENLPKFSDVRQNEPIFYPENFKNIMPLIDLVKGIAEKYGKTPSQVSLNWLLTSYDNVIVIPGAKNPEQVIENVGAADWKMSYDDWLLLEEESRKITIYRSLNVFP
ncbi:aldo/keto reductase [Fervidicoccus fontis]|uniref:Aldo/keto reductase n=1 Tax=Fervidicoccus fontis TaxID=683846 RepID=A0A843AAZ5_9CREN|nr:aldo/keto reductase [Fervidicoccus fontis]MBE9391002.1 aldo/keto reductase [Fervidicoccus fontis]